VPADAREVRVDERNVGLKFDPFALFLLLDRVGVVELRVAVSDQENVSILVSDSRILYLNTVLVNKCLVFLA